MEILVYIQIKEGEICEFSRDLISYAKEISNGALVSGVIVSSGFNLECGNLKKFGLDKLYVLKSDSCEFDKRKHPYLIIKLLEKINPEIFILNSTTEGRELAPVVSSSLDTGLTADCTKIEIVDNKLVSTRPTFGGKLMASILCRKNPQMATVRVNTFKKKEFQFVGETEILEFDFSDDLKNENLSNLKTEILEFTEKGKGEFVNLQNAKIIFAGGMGLKNKENFDKLKSAAEKFGAKVGGTRKAVDKGFIEKEFQIGQTGCCVTPEIYVAFGISGAIHHISGMENSKKIIAINTDKNAPIFAHSDMGIIEDAAKVLEFLNNV